MDSTDGDTPEGGSNGHASNDEELPSEVPSDSVLFDGDEDDEQTTTDADADSGRSIGRRTVLGGLGVAGVGVAGIAVGSGVLSSGDDSDDTDGPETTAPSSGPTDETADETEPSVSFDNQPVENDTVEATVTTPGEYTLLVTYGDDGDRVVAGTADANDLDAEPVTVEIADAGAVPGAHTAHLVDADSGDYEAGETLSPVAIDGVVDADTAFVSGQGDEAETGVTFEDQALYRGAVSLELTTPDDHFVLVTYPRGDEQIVAGADDTSNLDGSTRTVDVVDQSGVPGEHTAHVLANDDGSQFYVPGDRLSEQTADVVTASETATVSEPDAERSVDVTFADQSAGNGSVTLTATAPDAHFVLVTYRSGDDRIVAGAGDVSGFDGEQLTVELGDARGVSGLHTAYIIAEEDGSQFYEAGDAVSEATVGSVKVAATASLSDE
ncbi:hypothetical protein SAMN06269185_3142 [Natronoarchaeum philippinense]|uniref:Uncharacterized protein n=1 Tax=Natronoarchaeum philippinense TaxID=558529 RepID=A0A285P7Z5_NATPI|nr:hypothetical protein [Natronoarchaeum philippinense]SNZ17844.1 hypothetical protein SAMN06269185_3142 [Natronoarchaeum philippinense]